MCPVCIATAVLIAGGVASAGGLAAAAMNKFGVKNALATLGRAYPPVRRRSPRCLEELPDDRSDLFRVTPVRRVSGARNLGQPSARQKIGSVSRPPQRNDWISRTVHDKCGCGDIRQFGLDHVCQGFLERVTEPPKSATAVIPDHEREQRERLTDGIEEDPRDLLPRCTRGGVDRGCEEHGTFDQLGMAHDEVGDDLTTERVADERGTLDIHLLDEHPKDVGEVVEAQRLLGPVALAEPREIGCEDGIPARELRRGRYQIAARYTDPVNEDDRKRAARYLVERDPRVDAPWTDSNPVTWQSHSQSR